MDVVKIEVTAEDFSVEKPAGMLERMRYFFVSPEPKGSHAENTVLRQSEHGASVQLEVASTTSD